MFKSILVAGVAAVLFSLPAQAKEWKEIRIATEGAYPPFNFLAADGTLQGMDVEIAQALCVAMEAKCEIVANDWDGMIPGLQANKFDAVVASMSITEDRKKQVAFTDKYYSTPLSVVVPKDSPITSVAPEAFADKVVGAQGSTTQSAYAEDVYGKAGAEVKLYPTADEANADLKSGRVDAVVSDKFPIADWVKGDGADCCKMLGDIPGTQTDTAIALRKGDDDLREQFNAAIKKIREDGTYDTIVKKYFDFDIY
ncbi:ABC transporter substrate-binding protein [Falsochrobactrum ovis]|uniref:Amino acid ABC transporter substrate-binding protein (PAAT family) n=1 Tax=Falsochrobactrum ovis TaxID=1293442 RepID=A0A364JWL4_9HYPH|nr:ABC transporter substrate-binding protein [Falsochrobactrum ovis]RAK30875.1 amino acid ABC transporter substrate-binding protein (PAAT family) [Falsochrobactrum ovis]